MLEHLFLSDHKINRLILSYHCLKILPSIEVEKNVYAVEFPKKYAPIKLEGYLYTNEPTHKILKPLYQSYRALGMKVGPNREPIFDKIYCIGSKITHEAMYSLSNNYVYAHRYPELLEEIRDNIRILQGDRSIVDVDNRLSNSIPKMWSYIEGCEDLIISLGGRKLFEHTILTEDMLEGWDGWMG